MNLWLEDGGGRKNSRRIPCRFRTGMRQQPSRKNFKGFSKTDEGGLFAFALKRIVTGGE